jgi:hypothetical protein
MDCGSGSAPFLQNVNEPAYVCLLRLLWGLLSDLSIQSSSCCSDTKAAPIRRDSQSYLSYLHHAPSDAVFTSISIAERPPSHPILLLYLPDQLSQIRNISQWLRTYHLYAITHFFWMERKVRICPGRHFLPIQQRIRRRTVEGVYCPECRGCIVDFGRVRREFHLGLAPMSGH